MVYKTYYFKLINREGKVTLDICCSKTNPRRGKGFAVKNLGSAEELVEKLNDLEGKLLQFKMEMNIEEKN